MVIFHFSPKDMSQLNNDESRQRIMDSLKKFQEADEELEKICKELGIEKPEMVCRGMEL